MAAEASRFTGRALPAYKRCDMASVGDVQLEGFDQLKAKLLVLPKKVLGKVARPALRAGAKLVHAAAKETVPVGETGQLKRSLKVRAGKRSRKGMSVNVETTSRNFGGAFYGAFVEFGHKIGKRPAGLRRKNNPTVDTRTKAVPGVHFMEEAFQQKKDEAAQVIARMLADGIVREARGSSAGGGE